MLGTRLRARAFALALIASVPISAATLFAPCDAYAKLGQGEAVGVASGELDGVDRDLPAAIANANKSGIALRSAEQMIADGDLLFRLRDYPRAILVFSQIMEKYPNNKPAYAEATYRAGEALYASRDFLSARTKFKLVADHSKESEYRPYASKAVARLVDIAMRVDDPKDPKSADEVLARINSLGAGEVDSTILYAKGKALFFKKDYDAAKASLGSVGADGGFQHQARYILGVIAMKQAAAGKYAAAIDAFRKATELPGDTDDHKEVVDLSWMAIGRLFYEMDQLDQAILAYQHVDRSSKHFDTMLYEIAWVYVRQEDQDKATRALDLLALANPDSPYSVEGELLKADILLRKADFKKALETYEKVRDELDPLRKRIDDYLASGKTASEYYDKLTGAQLEALDGPDSLPPLVIRWAKEQEDGALAFAVVEDVAQTKELLTQAQAMLDKLQLVAKGSNRLRAFPEMKDGYQRVLALLNRVSRARGDIGEGLDDAEPGDLSGYPEIDAVREQRRRLEKLIWGLPYDEDGFAKREEEAAAQWRGVSQQLQQRQIEIDMLQAQVNALRRYLKTKVDAGGQSITPQQVAEYQKQLEDSDKELQVFKKEAADLRVLVEQGKVQVGIGDARFQNDENAREQYRDVLEKEVSLVAAQLGGDAKSYASKAQPVLARARVTETKVKEQKAILDAELAKKVGGLQVQLDAEQAALNSYRDQLAKFDEEARGVVGEVAKRNLGLVRDKLTALVMRAEVGIVDQAWNEREVRKTILRDRQIELKEQERLLDDELKAITNDGAAGIE
ncbi:MAG: tetratricopeptide repeat protein [Polyangiales bacterium]